MRSTHVLAVCLAIAGAAAMPSIVYAKGCLKGAAVGGLAGHVAGQHAVLGAAAGCAVEHHREKVAAKKAGEAPPANSAPAPAPTK